jgi:hypothetical protein
MTALDLVLKTPVFVVILIQVGRGSEHVVLGIISRPLFLVSQSREHARRCFPGDLTVRIEVPHGIARFLKFKEDFGKQLRVGPVSVFVLPAVVFTLNPES